ncbi:lysine--tRNA ligase [Candidatus Microgenomates bacterium]|nr:lysine--tRNA ligase [Candidatus Microgenomates bacterium]
MATRLEEIQKIRQDKLTKLKDLGINPYPSRLLSQPEKISLAKKKKEGQQVNISGRISRWREHGNSIFADLKDDSDTFQIFFQKKNLGDQFKITKLFDVGDILLVSGKIFTTGTGEITVDVESFQLLSKSVRPMPDDWYGLKDIEDRYRKRYLDLLFNPEVRTRFNARTKLVSAIRRYLDDLGYWEVETPVLQPLYGGANAKPFKTHLNSLDVDMYLRIADELYLKRLVVGGYERVYEISKDFRNEGMDLTHNPEFTMIEYYEAYADYHRMMDVTEGMFKHLAKHLNGETKLQVGKKTIDIGDKWPRIEMTQAIKDHLKIDVNDMSEEELIKHAKENKIQLVGGETNGQLIYTLFEHLVTDQLVEPTWIIDYPKDVSPLSKDHPEKPGWVERFEGYIGGKEICDGWSELTDPSEQRIRFEIDKKAARKDKEEAQQVDEDFLEAMEYGMPPLGGIGIGIDRLTMFFTNTWSIKEVMIYPTMRPTPNK